MLVIEQVQVLSQEHGYYLEDDELKPFDNNMSRSFVNRSSGFLGMRSVLYMGRTFSCTQLFTSITVQYKGSLLLN